MELFEGQNRPDRQQHSNFTYEDERSPACENSKNLQLNTNAKQLQYTCNLHSSIVGWAILIKTQHEMFYSSAASTPHQCWQHRLQITGGRCGSKSLKMPIISPPRDISFPQYDTWPILNYSLSSPRDQGLPTFSWNTHVTVRTDYSILSLLCTIFQSLNCEKEFQIRPLQEAAQSLSNVSSHV